MHYTCFAYLCFHAPVDRHLWFGSSTVINKKVNMKNNIDLMESKPRDSHEKGVYILTYYWFHIKQCWLNIYIFFFSFISI